MFPIGKMCNVMKVSRSGYYNRSLGVISQRVHRCNYIKEEIKMIFERSKKRYGSPRITRELRSLGMIVSENFVAKRMKEMNIHSMVRKKYRVTTTDSSHGYATVENVLDRDFTAKAKNEKWVSDITYIPTLEGFIYLTTVLDLFDRKVIGWALSDTMKAQHTTLSALRMALVHRPLEKSAQLVFHSDRGVQYACDDFVIELGKNNITRSMSRKGDCWDNAVAESFFKTLKAELVYHENYQTKKQAMQSIFEYIETFYNTTRRHSHLNNLSIFEFEKLITTNNNLKNAA